MEFKNKELEIQMKFHKDQGNEYIYSMTRSIKNYSSNKIKKNGKQRK